MYTRTDSYSFVFFCFLFFSSLFFPPFCLLIISYRSGVNIIWENEGGNGYPMALGSFSVFLPWIYILRRLRRLAVRYSHSSKIFLSS
jgi:hypothetical protein